MSEPASDSESSGRMSAAAIRRKIREEKMEEELAAAQGEDSVQVCVRIRPFNKREMEIQKQSGEPFIRSVIEMPEGMAGKVVCLEKDGLNYNVVEEFQFSKSFWSVSEEQQPSAFAPVDQQDVFEAVGKPVLKYAFVGFNNCVFAYGQTGSGKTYTMMGDFATEEGEWVGSPGIIPRLCRELFSRIEQKRLLVEEGILKVFDVKLTAIEIYNEDVRDLFWRSVPGRTKNSILKVRMHPVEGAFVDQVCMLNPTCWEHCIKLIDDGVKERTVAATLMNAESSRSHSVFQITLTQSETIHVRADDDDLESRYSKPVTHKKISLINLVDLAGSERLKKSGAQGQHLKEAATINQSLSTLKRVIDALVSNYKELNPKKHVIIPFRESTLTLLLSHSLGGNSKTTMIACVSPHYDNQEETLLTLRYASRAKGIVNHAKINEDNAAKAALNLKHQILELQRRLESGEDTEGEDLRDQLDVGKLALKDIEKQNMELEKQAEEMKTKTKKEEGARYAAAFYNTLRMVMLQQQKELMEQRASETTDRLKGEKDETERLRRELEESQAEEERTEKLLKDLSHHNSKNQLKDQQMEEYRQKLLTESEDVRSRLEHEIELVYAQRLVNTRKRRIIKEKVQAELDSLQKEQDETLSSVILQAAEQYEQQVRQFADAETAIHNRISKAEKSVQRDVAAREKAERRASELHQEINKHDKAHTAAMDKIDAEWKSKYSAMKQENEQQIEMSEQELFEENRDWDERIDNESIMALDEQQRVVAEMEGKIREREIYWQRTVSQAIESANRNTDEAIKQSMVKLTDLYTKERKELEQKIGGMLVNLRSLELLGKEHEETISTLESQVAPLIKLHDQLKVPDPPTASPELKALRSLFHHYCENYHSTPVTTRKSPSPSPPSQGMIFSPPQAASPKRLSSREKSPVFPTSLPGRR